MSDSLKAGIELAKRESVSENPVFQVKSVIFSLYYSIKILCF